MNARILASLVRITDPLTAAKLADRMLFDVRPLEGDAIAGQMWGSPGPGIVVDQAWLDGSIDETLDRLIAHELTHTAYGPGGEDVKAALGNFAMMKARFVPKEARGDYNAATDAIIEAVIGRTAP